MRPLRFPISEAPLLLMFVIRDAPLLFVKFDVEAVENEANLPF